MAGLAANTRDFTIMGPAKSLNWKELIPSWTIENLSYLVFFSLATALVTFIILQNLAPFGATATYRLSDDKNDYVSALGPADRVKETKVNGEIAYKQTGDLVYFTTKMPYRFDTASLTMQIKNADPTQEVKIGFKDQGLWHYDTKTVQAPLLAVDTWEANGENPVFFQRESTYQTYEEFLDKASSNTLVGTYQYDDDSLYTALPNYQPSKKETVINSALRGSYTMYVYLEDEPFSMTFERQDLNWYEGPDTMTISVYKATELVHEASLVDDGIIDTSKKNTGTKALTVKNPGPDLPEPGVYKVVVKTTPDSITTKVKTNLQKIVFAGPIFLADNAIYKPAVKQTRATKLFTDALLLDISTAHEAGLQRITSGVKSLRLTDVQQTEQIIPPDPLAEVTIPKNDVTIDGLAGYFAFEKSHYFQPTKFKVLPITQEAHMDLVDYVVSSVKPSIEENGWQTIQQTFNLSSAVIEEGRLSWLIQAPGMNKKNNSILIKDITLSMHKDSRL